MRISDWSSDVCSSDLLDHCESPVLIAQHPFEGVDRRFLVLEFQRFGLIADGSESLKDSMGVINNRVIDNLMTMIMGYFPSRSISHGPPQAGLHMSREQLHDITTENNSHRWLDIVAEQVP